MLAKENAKNILKKLGLLNISKSIYHGLFNHKQIQNKRLRNIYISSYNDYLSAQKSNSTAQNYTLKLRLNIHSIEKVLVEKDYTLLKNPGFFMAMLQKCTFLLENNTSPTANIIEEALSAINLAQQVAAASNIDFTQVTKGVQDFCSKYNLNISNYTGIQICQHPKGDLQGFSSFEAFIKNRHSIREFAAEIVDEATIKGIIQIAQICPSACNRQSAKVYYTTAASIQKELRNLNYQACAKEIYNYMVVCINISEFSPAEAFQSYVDGGIFVQNLLLAIHGAGLGACLFQTVKGSGRYEKYKQLLAIDSREDIICVIGYGYFKDTVRYIQTHRKDIEEVAVCRN